MVTFNVPATTAAAVAHTPVTSTPTADPGPAIVPATLTETPTRK